MLAMGQLQPAAMLSAWWLLLDANQSSGDPFFANTNPNVSSYRKQSLNTTKRKRQSRSHKLPFVCQDESRGFDFCLRWTPGASIGSLSSECYFVLGSAGIVASVCR